MGAAVRKSAVHHDYTIKFPLMEWDPESKGRHGSLTSDCTFFYNIDSERSCPAQHNPRRFSGVRGTVPLSNTDVIYYEIHLDVVAFVPDLSRSYLGELGLASEDALSMSSEQYPVSIQSNDGLSICLSCNRRKTRFYISAFLGESFLEPKEHKLKIIKRISSHHPLGFLFNGPQRRLHIINALDLTVLWKCHLEAKKPLWPYVGIKDSKGTKMCCMHINCKYEPKDWDEKINFLQDLVCKRTFFF